MSKQSVTQEDLDKLELFEYQQDASNFIINNLTKGLNTYLVTFAGGGKSAIALDVIKHMKYKRVLILAPKILLKNWEVEIKKWDAEDCEYVISTYESITKSVTPKKEGGTYPRNFMFHADYIIMDEAQKVKNNKAKRTKAAFKYRFVTNKHLEKYNKRCATLYMSASPFDRPIDLFNVLSKEKIVTNWKGYVRKFCGGYTNSFGGMVTTGSSNIPQLKQALGPFMLVQNEDLIDLPPITAETIVFNTTQQVVKNEKAFMEEFDVSINDIAKYLTQEVDENGERVRLDLEFIAKMRKNVGSAKVKPCIEYLEDVSPDDPALIFVYHQDVGEELLDALGSRARLVNGARTKRQNDSSIEEFDNGKVQYLILSLTSASEGLTLTRANRVIFAELPWNASNLYQATKRVHRISQTKPVFVTYLALNGTLDAHMSGVLEKKARTMREFGIKLV